MASNFRDLVGVYSNKFKFGLQGLWLSVVSGKFRARNAADNADAPIVGSIIASSGDSLELNEDAAGSGADWKFTLQRPSSGMTQNLTLILPATVNAGDALVVQSFAAGVIQLASQAVAAGNDKVAEDTTSIAHNQGTTTSLFTLPANALIKEIRVIVDTQFNGTPSLSVGIAGQTAKYMGATDNDLTAVAETSFAVTPNKTPVGTTEAIIATYSAGGASAGAARILVTYVIPS